MNKRDDAVPTRKSGNELCAMFGNTTGKIIGDSNIEDTARSIRKDVNEEARR
jgi:hypothetical protein